jgi:putative nucleotidyltransferase with HDIG domain
LNREEALDSVKVNVEDEDMVRHMLATEAVMRALARRLGEDEEEWGLTGLLHDIDVELINGDMYTHSKLGADLARELGASDVMTHAILCHNRRHGISIETGLDAALICADALPKLIMAAALAQSDKGLAGLEVELVKNRYGEKDFAPEADRERIVLCREIGLEPAEFLELGLVAMRKIAPSLRM